MEAHKLCLEKELKLWKTENLSNGRDLIPRYYHYSDYIWKLPHLKKFKEIARWHFHPMHDKHETLCNLPSRNIKYIDFLDF